MVTRRLHPSLPIFRIDAGDRAILYTPGSLAVVTLLEADAIRSGLASDCWSETPPSMRRLAAGLRVGARRTVDEWSSRAAGPFSPECLTLYPSTRCNLACRYCFTADREAGPLPPQDDTAPAIDEECVGAAARLVAERCAEKRRPFHLVLHGGGEPSIHPTLVERLVGLTRRTAAEHGIDWFGYLATNGVMPEDRARWLAGHFDLIGLSCDGPPEIQNRQRPAADGRDTSATLERIARILADAGVRFTVRSTITPETLDRQAEIVRYLHDRLGATEIRFEPIYRPHGSARPGFSPNQADAFVRGLLAAQDEARARGCDLTFSGVRLDELHGPYCNAARDVLQLTPDGTGVGCLLCTDGRSAAGQPFRIGAWDEAAGTLRLDSERAAALRRAAFRIPSGCQDCLCAYHCARGCPETCLALHSYAEAQADGFRCRVNRGLAEAWILQAAAPLLSAQRDATSPPPHRSRPSGPDALRDLLCQAPSSVDAGAIRRQWEALDGRWSIAGAELPLPVWARRGFDHSGPEAWRQLPELPTGAAAAPISLYIHVPFCDRRCGFCNSYAFPLRREEEAREDAYTQALTRDMAAWSAILALGRRPVTTVHFGGGTPNHLRSHAFAHILAECRARFSVTDRTEWALESTGSLLTPEHLTQLTRWGFTRLHVGVQTLEDPVRRRIGRREAGHAVLAALARALERGFVVSADVMYGLPGETLAGLLASLDRLSGIGLHGFSVYGLYETDRNRRFLARHGGTRRNSLHGYVCFQAAEQCLVRHGYRKTHFTHYALPQDTNLYYAYPQRGEDLLALGPTADGAFGCYHYRYAPHASFLAGGPAGAPALEGGVWESPLERRLRPAETALLAGRIARSLLGELDAASLLTSWLEDHLLIEDAAEGCVLTANGSWFVGTMLDQLTALVAARG